LRRYSIERVPVGEAEAGHTTELAGIVGDQDGAAREGSGGDENVERADELTTPHEIEADLGGGIRSGTVKRGDGDRTEQRLEFSGDDWTRRTIPKYPPESRLAQRRASRSGPGKPPASVRVRRPCL
jgi:hypothetical protein